jgi:SAM-dependent methyltransferase
VNDCVERATCRLCESRDLERVLELEPTPPGNRFLSAADLSLPEPRYPLELRFCRDCHHVQLGHVVDPRILYQNSYSYVSATSGQFVRHLREYAAAMIDRFSLGGDDLVVDIGSNDGTCLRGFAGTTQVLGVDPATEIAEDATRSGIPTVADFFSYALAARLRSQQGTASFITSHNTCAHIDDLAGVFRGVAHWLAPDGVFVFEVGYLLDVVENLWFDTIYHEHLDYHTIGPLPRFLARVGMEAFAVERVSPQGGSIRVFVQHAGGPHSSDGSVEALIGLERERGLDSPRAFAPFRDRIATVRAEAVKLIRAARAAGRSIAGYGAPTKATTLLTHFGIGRSEIDFIVEDNPLKQGLFTPGSHIPVYPPAELYERRPDHVLLLAWNFAGPIMAAHSRYVKEGGSFMLPMPWPRIVGA